VLGCVFAAVLAGCGGGWKVCVVFVAGGVVPAAWW
jgi:hypothetical protein